MTRLCVRLGGALLLFAVAPHAHAAACAKPLGRVDSYVCNDPASRAEMATAEHSFRRTLKTLAGRRRTAFAATDRFWSWTLHDCGNADAATQAYGEVPACTQRVLAEQRDYLSRSAADSRFIDAQVARFGIVDVPYLARYLAQYDGKSVTVMGTMRMRECGRPDPVETRGAIVDRSATIPIAFSSLDAAQLQFLCEKRPESSWRGHVQRGPDGLVLILEDLLGTPLH